MPALTDPPPPPWGALLRRAVVDHALAEHRRRHPALLHVGRPGLGEVVVPADDGDGDLALRVDVVAAALRRVVRSVGTDQDPDQALDQVAPGPPLVWLTRTGTLELQDVDVAWLGAAGAACAEAGTDLTMVVVNRHGWRDPRTGAARHWRRIRRR